MDVAYAKTFLAILETGNFIEASKRLFVTQSTVSARIKALEDQLGKTLFLRSRGGCTLTPAGQQFYRFARSMVRAWEEAKHHVAVPDGFDDTLIVGGQYSLWNRLLLQWVPTFRALMPRVALRCEIGMPRRLIREMSEGVMDFIVVYRPEQRPGFIVEELMTDQLVMVTADPARPYTENYIYNDWGEEFRDAHAAAFPDLVNPGLTLDLGALGVNMLINLKASGYFPERVVQTHLKTGLLERVPDAPVFPYPAYVVYQEAFSTPAIIAAALSSLKQTSEAAMCDDLQPPYWASI